MPVTEFQITSSDGLPIACARWDSPGPARGVIQIAHGMGEHIGRYAETIEFLTTNGFTVFANDHRGHGRSAPDAKQVGEFGPGGFDLLVADMVRLSRIAREQHPNMPLFLLGHSMGSFAAQQFALDHNGEIDGLILSGTGALDILAQAASSFPPGTNILNLPFEPARTPVDWLSRDTATVDAYINDPLCFDGLRPAAYASFLGAAPRLADPALLRRIRPDLPIYFFSGGDDPVGQQLQGVGLQIERYRQAGISAIAHDFYPGGRHEMLNEINRDEVRARLLAWLSATLDQTT